MVNNLVSPWQLILVVETTTPALRKLPMHRRMVLMAAVVQPKLPLFAREQEHQALLRVCGRAGGDQSLLHIAANDTSDEPSLWDDHGGRQ